MNQEMIYKALITPFHEVYTFPNGNTLYLGSQSAVGGFPDMWNYTDKDFKQVHNHLYEKGIKYVVCCAELYDLFSDIEYLHIPMESNDNFDISNSVMTALPFIENKLKNGSVLVHCNAGCHRSATIVVSYLMKQLNWDIDTAHNFVKSKRPCINIDNFREKVINIFNDSLRNANIKNH